MLILEDVQISFARQIVLSNFNLSVADTEIGCLLGPSGCGKTSLLRAIAGFQTISNGKIKLQGKIISQPEFKIPPEQRNIGMVFQDYALFPHLNIADNIAFGIQDFSRTAKFQRIKELLKLVDLADYSNRYPHQLSGGQQQRIALARALAPRPQVLLLDEPFGSQDLEFREELAREVRSILRSEGTTALLVTHDQHEAYAMADNIGVIQQGTLEQWDTAYQIYHNPVNRAVAGFIGDGVFLSGEAVSDSQVKSALGILQGQFTQKIKPGSAVEILLRPDDVLLDETSEIKGKIIDRVFRGAEYQYTLKINDQCQVLMLAPSHQEFAEGSSIGIKLDMQHMIVFPINNT